MFELIEFGNMSVPNLGNYDKTTTTDIITIKSRKIIQKCYELNSIRMFLLRNFD